MTQKDKELLLKDLCARLPYGVMCACGNYNGQLKLVCPEGDYCVLQNSPYAIETIKPYLRPMSSMTEEERNELIRFGGIVKIDTGEVIDVSCLGFKHHANNQDWLNAHHFDYRGLIPMGLALEAPEGMYNINEK